ncbi:hypothetical protein B0I27_101293 [Arcticibacter pallidicorallinus]|uniref:Uncharacterized protein n=1 Tax=Arcticibacter pallidicorallinus TaxID=1259464 RepID=A0A2T0UBQ5_9SPHI|nr:hypothetical protein B0I27_101293 [Arcticibacter pallidicorallinus]
MPLVFLTYTHITTNSYTNTAHKRAFYPTRNERNTNNPTRIMSDKKKFR